MKIGTNRTHAGGAEQAVVEGGLQLALGDIRSRGPKALSASLEEELRRAIRAGRLRAGARLPASRDLAADLAVSRGVVVRAYQQLVAEGYLHARQGRGTVVGHLDVIASASAPTVTRSTPSNPGEPALAWFPKAEWLRATEVAVRQLGGPDLAYGDPRGHPRLREALARYLGRTRAVVAPPDRIVVTSGFAQGIRLVAEALALEGAEVIGVEDPGSMGVVSTIEYAGPRVEPVPVDDEGIVVDALEASSLGAVLVTPAHQFPTGAVLAPHRRTALLSWAGTRGAVVIEDDYDAEYRYDRAPVGALQGLAPEQVVYGGSVSKTLAPALRIGWLVAPGRLAGILAEAKFWADIGTPVVEQLALAEFLDSGAMDRHTRRTAARYAARRRHLVAAVSEQLPGWRATGIAAGLHAVLVPPDHVRDGELRAAAAASGEFGVVALSAYTHGPAPRRGLVVGYGNAPPDRIRSGVAAIAASLAVGVVRRSPI